MHLCDETAFFEDDEGIELPDLSFAHATAVTGLRDILASAIRKGELNTATCIEIENEQHQSVLLVSVEDAVRMTSERARDRPLKRLEPQSPITLAVEAPRSPGGR